MFTTATLLRFAAQLLAAYALKYGAILDLQHIPGKENHLAERLCRQHSPGDLGLSISRRVDVSLKEILKLALER